MAAIHTISEKTLIPISLFLVVAGIIFNSGALYTKVNDTEKKVETLQAQVLVTSSKLDSTIEIILKKNECASYDQNSSMALLK